MVMMMPAKPNERQYRAMTVVLRSLPTDSEREKRIESDYYVEGYASTFDDPYVLWQDPWDGTEYREIISPDAFTDTDMSDVIMQFDHCGDVLARMSNGTLIVEPDKHGLFIAADLSKSDSARKRFEEIDNGLVTRMSWAFTVGASEYDRDSHTTTITRVKKIYDVSAVSLPADPNTEISARNLLDGAIEQSHRESMRRRGALLRAKACVAINNAKKGM